MKDLGKGIVENPIATKTIVDNAKNKKYNSR